jgi:restriction system protein
MNIAPEDTEFLQNVVRDFWIPAFLEVVPNTEKDYLRSAIEKGSIKDVISTIPSWCLFRFLSEEGYTSRLLARNKQLWTEDRYGDIDPDHWFIELRQFIQKRIDRLEPACNNFPDYCWDAARRHSCTHSLQFNDKDFLFSQIASYVDALIFQEEDEANESEHDEPLDGYEFEHHVARRLKENGWSVHHTGKSGDQGADLIAEKESRRYVIQCKFSTYPISNSAIQEAHAARGFYRVQFAAVVTNSDFTRAARQLAASVGVDLTHVRDVSDL